MKAIMIMNDDGYERDKEIERKEEIVQEIKHQ
jgi:hypothetical protein